MSATSADQGHAPLLNQARGEILRAFPVLERLEFSQNANSHAGRLPTFVGLIAKVLESAQKPCCMVLPDCTGVALATTVLVAVSRLLVEFPEILRAHASMTFTPGVDSVLVHPSGFVYRYEGFFCPEQFRLGILDRRDSRSLHVAQIARLEKTNRKRPKGQLNSDLGLSRQTVIGTLVGTTIPINRNFLRNRVLVLGARKPLIESMDRWEIQTSNIDGIFKGALKDEVPFGKIHEQGRLSFVDDHVAAGEPLVAVTSHVESLAAHCTSAERFSKFVLVDDIDVLVRNLGAYDTIVENQRTVILATDLQRDSIRSLEARGCEVWRVTPEEILSDTSSTEAAGATIPLQTVLKKAAISQKLSVAALRSSHDSLDRAAEALIKVSREIRPGENGATNDLLQCLFRTLMVMAEHLGQKPEHFAASTSLLLDMANQRLENASVWMTTSCNKQVRSALADLQAGITDLNGIAVTPKGQALLESFQKLNLGSSPVALVVGRRENDPQEIKHWLNHSGFDADVISISTPLADRSYANVIVGSWPGWVRFDRLLHQYATQDLRLLAYGFEEKWLSGYSERLKRCRLEGISSERKAQLMGLSSIATLSEPSEQQSQAIVFDLPEEHFLLRRKAKVANQTSDSQDEELVDACYVDFAGPTFAFLTEGHEFPLLNAFVSGEQVNPGKVPLRSVERLKEHDYIMFRESGDSDIIRFLAEDEIGKDEYQRLRLMASRWRAPLRSLGREPRQVWERLRQYGFSRHLQTVRHWLVDENVICPQDITDIRKIAGATHDKGLFASLPDIERARDELFGSHIRAGYKLTELLLKDLPNKLNSLRRAETEIDLGVGKVWVVRVEEIDRTASPQRRSHINRLLWDAGAGEER